MKSKTRHVDGGVVIRVFMAELINKQRDVRNIVISKKTYKSNSVGQSKGKRL